MGVMTKNQNQTITKTMNPIDINNRTENLYLVWAQNALKLFNNFDNMRSIAFLQLRILLALNKATRAFWTP